MAVSHALIIIVWEAFHDFFFVYHVFNVKSCALRAFKNSKHLCFPTFGVPSSMSYLP